MAFFLFDFQEHGGNLNQAVNSHFTEGDTNMSVSLNMQIMLFLSSFFTRIDSVTSEHMKKMLLLHWTISWT